MRIFSWLLAIVLLSLVVFLFIRIIDILNHPAITLPPGTGAHIFSVTSANPPDQTIDIVFVPDDDYGNVEDDVLVRQAFVDDINSLITNGFSQNHAIAANQPLFNYWFLTLSGDVQPGAGICPSVSWPDLSEAAFAEVVVLLHPNSLRDCAFGTRVTSEPTSYRTVVHEFSHGAFGLPDEYCCDGGYWDSIPILYLSQGLCESDPINIAWRDCFEIVSTRNGNSYWRSEGTQVDIMSTGGAVVAEYGPADWLLVEQVLNGLGTGSVVTPTVFAPDPWP